MKKVRKKFPSLKKVSLCCWGEALCTFEFDPETDAGEAAEDQAEAGKHFEISTVIDYIK